MAILKLTAPSAEQTHENQDEEVSETKLIIFFILSLSDYDGAEQWTLFFLFVYLFFCLRQTYGQVDSVPQ